MINLIRALLSPTLTRSSLKSPCLRSTTYLDHFPFFVQATQHRLRSTRLIKCWKCGIERQNIHELFCQQCKIIQSPEDKNNYFKLLQQNEVFDIDLKALRDKYRDMQSVLHPDKFSNRSVEEKNISEDFSSLVNKAYDILQSPLKRAVHLLCLNGERIREDERIDDPKFLMEIMEFNEEVENASSTEKLKELNLKNRKTIENIEKELSDYFKENNLTKVKYCIIKLRYYNSIAVNINEIMRSKGIVE